jgi:hypothetical protein
LGSAFGIWGCRPNRQSGLVAMSRKFDNEQLQGQFASRNPSVTTCRSQPRSSGKLSAHQPRQFFGQSLIFERRLDNCPAALPVALGRRLLTLVSHNRRSVAMRSTSSLMRSGVNVGGCFGFSIITMQSNIKRRSNDRTAYAHRGLELQRGAPIYLTA